MSFIIPKKPQIMYAPMLASFGGGSARGFNPGGGDGIYTELDLRINAYPETGGTQQGVQKGGTLAQYRTNASGNNDASTTIVDRIGDGILVVPAKAGTYNLEAGSSNGSGGSSSRGLAMTNATMTLPSNVTLLILVGNNGTGQYSAGGGTFIATANSESAPTHTDMTSANAVLVIGGGGGGYTNTNAWQNPGAISNQLSNAESRQGDQDSSLWDYDAGFLNSYTPFSGEGGGYTSATIPHHFVQGGRGAAAPHCGTDARGGFGGGGGSCPSGGGGYEGGFSGSNTGQIGGGGGTSYYNSAYINASFSQAQGGFHNTNYSYFTQSASGYVSITPQ